MKRRAEFIDTDYVSGIYSDDGEELLRPLNDEEKSFLNKFNEETVNANFVSNPELRRKRKELKQIQLKLAEINPKLTDAIQSLYQIEKRLEGEITALREEHLLYPDPETHKQIYKEDYANKMCILSDRKSKGMLDEHKEEIFNKFYEDIAEIKDEAQVNEFHEKDMAERDIDEY